MRDIARRLLDAEKSLAPALPAFEAQEAPAALRVCDKLRTSLTRFAGADGFTSLLKRAVALSQAESPALEGIKVSSDGSLEGIEQLAAGAPAPGSGSEPAAEAAVAITAHLFELLMVFIGPSLTLRLVREAWPDASLEELE